MLPQILLRTAPVVHSFPNSARPRAPTSGGFGRIEAMASAMTFGPNSAKFSSSLSLEVQLAALIWLNYCETQKQCSTQRDSRGLSDAPCLTVNRY